MKIKSQVVLKMNLQSGNQLMIISKEKMINPEEEEDHHLHLLVHSLILQILEEKVDLVLFQEEEEIHHHKRRYPPSEQQQFYNRRQSSTFGRSHHQLSPERNRQSWPNSRPYDRRPVSPVHKDLEQFEAHEEREKLKGKTRELAVRDHTERRKEREWAKEHGRKEREAEREGVENYENRLKRESRIFLENYLPKRKE
ncbi:uncharacterized protein LOC143240673 [Tachypleus tridentatus]|uniref:uncharacterized protein LOC143240673 n=1 Tax=Tachypleus tridentatus TaxID=6853 RepID=UPI003FCFC82C